MIRPHRRSSQQLQLLALLACGAVWMAIPQAAAIAAGGKGQSYCSQSTGPQSGSTPFIAGPYGSFSNPGDVVSSLVGILWGQGVGAPAREPGSFTRTVCSGHGR